MPIDPAGTSPQPLIEAAKPTTINLKCRQGACVSMVAEEIAIPGNGTASGRHMYKCTKCNFTWMSQVGGTFEF